MQPITKHHLLKSIGRIFEKAKNSQLEDNIFVQLNSDLEILSNYFKTTPSQSFFLGIIFALNYKGNSVDFNDLIEYFDCNPMLLLEYTDDFNELDQRGFLKKERSNHRVRVAGLNNQFIINNAITDAVINGLPLPEFESPQPLTLVDVIENIYKLGFDRDDEHISTHECLLNLKEYIKQQQQFPLMKQLQSWDLKLADQFLFIYTVWKSLLGNMGISIRRGLQCIYDKPAKVIQETQLLISNEHPLIQQDLVIVDEGDFYNDATIKLSEKSIVILASHNLKLFSATKKFPNVITASSIVKKELIFDPEEMRQLTQISQLLQKDQLQSIQQRLSTKCLPKGINILLHGGPGTGKTEIVKQLARTTGRDIYKVEISQQKSMWFGESEKLIKRIFTDYAEYAQSCSELPILFFNEADAIISKRKENSISNVAQTENAIQNIILEELENFEGIFIATTNLVNNIDHAFERRFLYKVPFKVPNESILAQIWHSKLPHLSEEECLSLSQQSQLSGGQVDNIIRKNEIQAILNGSPATFAQLVEYALEEQLQERSNHRIGFNYDLKNIISKVS